MQLDHNQVHNEKPVIDILIVTSDRFQLLEASLRTLEISARNLKVRVLLGFNGATADYIKTARQMLESLEFSLGLQIYSFEKKWPGAARNELLKFSLAEWIFFCDDDVLIPENLLLNFIQLQRNNPEIQVFGGPNVTPPNSSRLERAQGYALGLTTVTGPISRRYLQRTQAEPDLKVNSPLGLTLCNLFWKRKNGIYFPENYICGEELNLLHSTEPPFIISSSLVIHHYRRSSWKAFFQQTFKYGIGRAHETPGVILAMWTLSLVLLASLIVIPGWVMAVVALYIFAVLVQAFLAINFNKEKWRLTFEVFFASLIILCGYTLGIMVGLLSQRIFKSTRAYEHS